MVIRDFVIHCETFIAQVTPPLTVTAPENSKSDAESRGCFWGDQPVWLLSGKKNIARDGQKWEIFLTAFGALPFRRERRFQRRTGFVDGLFCLIDHLGHAEEAVNHAWIIGVGDRDARLA